MHLQHVHWGIGILIIVNYIVYVIMSSIPKKYMSIVQCDWNAEEGDTSNEWKNVLGKIAL